MRKPRGAWPRPSIFVASVSESVSLGEPRRASQSLRGRKWGEGTVLLRGAELDPDSSLLALSGPVGVGWGAEVTGVLGRTPELVKYRVLAPLEKPQAGPSSSFCQPVGWSSLQVLG